MVAPVDPTKIKATTIAATKGRSIQGKSNSCQIKYGTT